MTIRLAFAAILVATPAAAQSTASLPGVADQETTIPSGSISQYHRGNGDVLFVLDRTGRWYRVGLNEGCLSSSPRIHSLAFQHRGGSQRVDRFTTVLIDPVGGAFRTTCAIDSIRRSEAPPQINSKSPVTLD